MYYLLFHLLIEAKKLDEVIQHNLLLGMKSSNSVTSQGPWFTKVGYLNSTYSVTSQGSKVGYLDLTYSVASQGPWFSKVG